MKIIASTYSFGAYMRREDFGIFGAIDCAAQLGFDGIEIVDGMHADCAGADTAARVAEYCREKGLFVSSFCTGADFIYGSGSDLREEIRRLYASVELAAAYGAALMRHDVAQGYRGLKHSRGYENALPRLAEGCREVTKYAEQRGIVTTTENHGYFSQDAHRVELLINEVAHDNFGALVDIGNFMCADEEPTHSVGLLAPYCRAVHAKDFLFKSGTETDPGGGWFRSRAGNYLRGTIIGHGEARACQSLGVLKRSGYDGCISVEFEGMEDNIVGLREGLANVRRFWEMN